MSSVSEAELFAQTFVENSKLEDSGLVPPPLSDYFMPNIQILCNAVFHSLAGLNPRKAYGSDRVPPIILKNCASVFGPYLVKLFCLCLSTTHLAGSLHTYNLFQRRMTAPIPQTTFLLMNFSLTGRFRGIYPFTILYLIWLPIWTFYWRSSRFPY